ncbi:hypothetical protein V6N11_067535 [Hibiscus sabdariffa]|uniref:Uncharacterized protein n=1 Tax=Hibiscus sabdariffa TaxID=183260 RepID=A0ABR2SS01_9ROSI
MPTTNSSRLENPNEKPAASQSAVTGLGSGRRASRPYGRLLGRRGGGRLGEKRERLLPVIGVVWAREAMSEARRGVDGWSRLDGSSYRGEFEG